MEEPLPGAGENARADVSRFLHPGNKPSVKVVTIFGSGGNTEANTISMVRVLSCTEGQCYGQESLFSVAFFCNHFLLPHTLAQSDQKEPIRSELLVVLGTKRVAIGDM